MQKIISLSFLFTISILGISQINQRGTRINEPANFIKGLNNDIQFSIDGKDTVWYDADGNIILQFSDSSTKVITGGLPGILVDPNSGPIENDDPVFYSIKKGDSVVWRKNAPAYDKDDTVFLDEEGNIVNTAACCINIGFSMHLIEPKKENLKNDYWAPNCVATVAVMQHFVNGQVVETRNLSKTEKDSLLNIRRERGNSKSKVFGSPRLFLSDSSFDKIFGGNNESKKSVPKLNVKGINIDRIFGTNDDQQQKSVLQLQSEQYSKYNFTNQEQWDSLYAIKNPNASAKKIFQTPTPSSCTLNKIVYGWNPYWISASQYNAYDYSLLSDLCYFSYDVNATTGGYTSIHSWATSGAVNNAIAAGCRVSLCATLFSNHTTFLNSVSARQNFITTMINLLQARGAKGVNIDFEGMVASNSANFTQFMIDLCTQMHAAIPGSKVTIAMPSVDWSTVMNVGALNPYVDMFIIMGYDYHWGSSTNAGPCSPLYHGNYWGTICCDNSIAYYLHAGASPNKLCLGVPYYGYDYPTSTNGLNSATTANGTAVEYYTTKPASQTYGQQWDNNSATPYYMYNNSGWHQAWYDDENSLTAKYDMVNQIGIGGIGIWALGYDDGYTQCWDAIRNEFTTCKAPQACSGTITDIGGPGNYFNWEDWTYTIAPPNANSVSLTFNSFDLELNYDFLKVYNGPSTLSPLIGTYTGTTNPGTLTANSGKMTLRFTSDVSTVHQGFNATWNCTHLNTGINDPSGIFNLNFYPNPFNAEATISYNLSAQSDVEIKLIDLLGKEIIILPMHQENSGEHNLILDANKYDLAQGMYVLKIRVNGKESFVKVVLQK